MAFSYNSVGQQVEWVLGNLKGAIPADAATNYAALLSTSTIKGPDFIPAPIQDAIFETITEIVQAIAETSLHPGRTRYLDSSANIASGDLIPETGAGGARFRGIIDIVLEDTQHCRPASFEKITDYLRNKSTTFADVELYFYCLNGRRLIHTRTLAKVSMVAFDQPTSFTGDVPLDDEHRAALVMGAVAKSAPKENMFTTLAELAAKYFADHLATIRAYNNPPLQAGSQFAPAAG